jgi:hypothetical protein
MSAYSNACSDSELLEKFPQFADRLAPWRKLATLMGYTGPVAWLVKQGFTLKKRAQLAGPCHDNLREIHDLYWFRDYPTDDCLVFWIPRLAEGSMRKGFEQMEEYRAELKKRYELPGNHATSFGSIQLLFALIFAHFNFTGGERASLDRCSAMSDTRCVNDHIFAGCFFDDGLDCNRHGLHIGDDVGFFLLGVEKIER